MPYKDTQKQKDYDKERKRRTRQGRTSEEDVLPENPQDVLPEMEGLTMISGGVKPIYVGVEKAAKLLMICNALDKSVHGLDGKKVSLLSVVRYGISGPTFTEIKGQLG